MASRYFLPAIARRPLVLNLDSHRACGPRHGVDRGREARGREILDLGLGDFLNLRAGNLAHLVLVGGRAALFDACRLEQQHRSGRTLGHEGERAVRVDRNDHRYDQSLHVLGLRVESLAELHDVDAALAQRGTDRWGWIRATRRYLQLDLTDYFLSHFPDSFTGAPPRLRGAHTRSRFFHLHEVKFDRSGAPEN